MVLCMSWVPSRSLTSLSCIDLCPACWCMLYTLERNGTTFQWCKNHCWDVVGSGDGERPLGYAERKYLQLERRWGSEAENKNQAS